MKTKSYIAIFILLLTVACKKDPVPAPDSGAELKFQLAYHADGVPLQFDTMIYTNAAGEKYSVSRLEYFISNVVLHTENGDTRFSDVFYLNAENPVFNGFVLKGLKKGRFTGVSFLLGIDSFRNIPDGLPPTIENNAMFWPVPMGGGYHFMKLEGHFEDTAGQSGFAVHLGRNGNAVNQNIQGQFELTGSGHVINLSMNINQWFRDPYTYSFIKDGKYTMSSMPLMQKIAGNGEDVFTYTFKP